MATDDVGGIGETGESGKERADRELTELLQGLRTAVTGVQVLFAFLLTVPFSSRFAETTPAQRWCLYAALVAAALATTCFIAPAAQHRLLFRTGQKGSAGAPPAHSARNPPNETMRRPLSPPTQQPTRDLLPHGPVPAVGTSPAASPKPCNNAKTWPSSGCTNNARTGQSPNSATASTANPTGPTPPRQWSNAPAAATGPS